MSTSIHSPEPIEPDGVLDAYVRRLTRAYRDQLTVAYEDPRTAYDAFRAVRESRGLGEAAIQMRENPASFGTLREGAGEAAMEAARLGSRAYHAVDARGNPTLAASVLDEAFSDALREAAGEAPVPRLRGAWDELSAAYGADRAAAVLQRRARDFVGVEVAPEAVESIAQLAAARDHLRERAGILQRPGHPSAPLPRGLRDEQAAPEQLPARLQERIVAAADGMRVRLAIAYEQPLVAEARLHALVGRDGLAGIETAERDPALLGELRADLAAGPADAIDAARAGLAYARHAYQYNSARFPDRAADIEAREALEAATRSARDPDRAMEGVQEAIQLHGHELEEHLERSRADRARGRGNGRGGPSGGGLDLPDDRPREPARGDAGDPAVDEAVRALTAMEEAREETERGRGLREERTRAEQVLERLDAQDRALARADRDFEAAAKNVYRDPEAALKKWDDLVQRERGNLEAARERVSKDPTVLGALRSEPHAAVWGPAAAKLGIANTQPAREAVPRMLDRAVGHTRAQREATEPVQWTAPDGETVHGRDRVRTAARSVVQDRTDDIQASDGKVRELGGVTGSERAAQRSLDGLTPAQRAKASTRMAAKGRGAGKGAASLATGYVGRAIQAARVTRDIAEGPAL